VIDQFLAQGCQVRGHALYCPAFRFAPPGCRQMNRDQLKQALQSHIGEQVGRYKGRIAQWDVVYAPLAYTEIYDVIGEASMVEAFKTAKANDPDAILLLRENKALLSPSPDRADELLALVKWLIGEGAPLAAIALDAELTRPYIAPQAIEHRLDRIAASLRVASWYPRSARASVACIMVIGSFRSPHTLRAESRVWRVWAACLGLPGYPAGHG